MTRAEQRREATKKKLEDDHKKKLIKQAIKMVNTAVKLRLGVSEVHGVGVFAMRNIKKGEQLYANAIPCLVDIPYKDFDKLRPETSKMILEHFPQVTTGSHFMSPDTLMQMYMNHGNTKEDVNYDSATDKSLKAIKKGEEVFEDYKKIKGCEKLFTFINN
jgi:hypothetical protein